MHLTFFATVCWQHGHSVEYETVGAVLYLGSDIEILLQLLDLFQDACMRRYESVSVMHTFVRIAASKPISLMPGRVVNIANVSRRF